MSKNVFVFSNGDLRRLTVLDGGGANSLFEKRKVFPKSDRRRKWVNESTGVKVICPRSLFLPEKIRKHLFFWCAIDPASHFFLFSALFVVVFQRRWPYLEFLKMSLLLEK